jgi:hypothetical protein
MLLSSEDRKKYPDLYYWIVDSLAKLPYEKPKIFNAYQKYAGETIGLFGSSYPLMWGTLPYLVPDPRMIQCEDDGEEKIGDNRYVMRKSIHWYGMTPPNYSSNKIVVAADLVQGLGTSEIEDVLEGTVLHELIHWTRLKAGLDVNDENPSYAFEDEAYGHRVRRTWKSCFEQEYYYVPPR